MQRVGVRELRQNASKLLESVAAGESVEITVHGKPVARLVPVPEPTGIEALIAAGKIRPARGSIQDLPPPVPLADGSMTGSKALERQREERYEDWIER